MFVIFTERGGLLALLTHVFKYLKVDPNYLEVGVHRGDWAVAVSGVLKPKKMLLIDPWDAEVLVQSYSLNDDRADWLSPIEERNKYYKVNVMSQTEVDTNFEFVKTQFMMKENVTIKRATSEAAFWNLQENGELFNYIYIDGAHNYDAVFSDIYSYSQLLDPETGVMQLNDCMFSHSLMKQRGAVLPALVDFLKANPDFIPVVINTNEYADCMVVRRGSLIHETLKQLCPKIADAQIIQVPYNFLSSIRFLSDGDSPRGYISFGD